VISRTLRFWTRALLAAMLLATLAPAISRTLNASRDVGDWVEICSGTSMRWVQVSAALDPDSASDSKDLQSQLDDCGYCLLAAERFAPLIPSLPVFTGPTQTWPTPLHRGVAMVRASALPPIAQGPPLLF
jgi:hypothetical protein